MVVLMYSFSMFFLFIDILFCKFFLFLVFCIGFKLLFFDVFFVFSFFCVFVLFVSSMVSVLSTLLVSDMLGGVFLLAYIIGVSFRLMVEVNLMLVIFCWLDIFVVIGRYSIVLGVFFMKLSNFWGLFVLWCSFWFGFFDGFGGMVSLGESGSLFGEIILLVRRL